jgi:hypothetical protein
MWLSVCSTLQTFAQVESIEDDLRKALFFETMRSV